MLLGLVVLALNQIWTKQCCDGVKSQVERPVHPNLLIYLLEDVVMSSLHFIKLSKCRSEKG